MRIPACCWVASGWPVEWVLRLTWPVLWCTGDLWVACGWRWVAQRSRLKFNCKVGGSDPPSVICSHHVVSPCLTASNCLFVCFYTLFLPHQAESNTVAHWPSQTWPPRCSCYILYSNGPRAASLGGSRRPDNIVTCQVRRGGTNN